MNELQDKASLHENAVQAIASGEVTPVKKKRRKKKSTPVATEVEHLKVNGEVWTAAKAILADKAHGYTKI
jgi:hypothetical protein